MLSEMPEHWLVRDGQVYEPSQEPPRGVLSMLSEMPEHWLAMDGQVSEPSQEPPRGALSMLSEMPEQWFARDGQEWVPSQEPQGSEFDFDLPPEPSEKGDPDGSQGGSFSTSMSRQELPEEPVSESEKTETSISCSAHHGVKGYCNAAAWPSAQWTMPELVGLEPDHVDVFCQSALERCGTCPTSVKAYTTHKVERELSELCRLLEHKAASLASTTCDPDQDDTSSSKHTTSEDGDWEGDPASFLAPVQPEVSAETETTISGSAVVATRAEREREADPDASRQKKPGFMDRMLRTFCPSLVKSRSDKDRLASMCERGDEVANLPRFAGAEASSAPEPLRPDMSPGSPSSLGAGVGDIE